MSDTMIMWADVQYRQDNRYSPGGSGVRFMHAHTPAAYSARWIDQGDLMPADVVPDRQGFAYDDEADRSRLIDFLTEADPRTLAPGLPLDRSMHVVADSKDWQLWMRRAGGYVYVDAWLVPA